jgi:hypothetical protein
VDEALDGLSPLYLLKKPSAAAVSSDGAPSHTLVSIMQLVEGPYGQQIFQMIEAIAANYPVDSISINELTYHHDDYGPDDRRAYKAYAHRPD